MRTISNKEMVDLSDVIRITNKMINSGSTHIEPALSDDDFHDDRIAEVMIDDEGNVFVLMSDGNDVVLPKLINM